MATDEIVAPDHASATDEKIVNKEKSEAIADMIDSLANEDEVKHDKTRDDEYGSVTTNSSSKTGDETNNKVVAIEIQNSDDSPALVASDEDNLKRGKIEEAQTREYDTKAEPDVSVEKTEGTVSLEAHIEDSLKEKEVIPALHASNDRGKSQLEEQQSTEPTVEETPLQPEKEPVVTEEKQPKTVDISYASSETVEKLSNNTIELNTQTESELVKEAEIFEVSDPKEEKLETELEPVVTELEEKLQEPEKELEAAVVKEAEILETTDQNEEKPEIEPKVLATEVGEKIQEPKKELQAKVAKEVETSETSDQKEEKPEHEVVPLIPEVQEKTKQPEEEKTRELSAEIMKETNESESVPTETAKAESVVPEVEKKPKEPEKESLEQKEEKQPNTITIDEVSSEIVEVIQEKTSEPEVLNEEYFEVEEKPRELVEVAEDVREIKKEESKQEIVLETATNEVTSADTILQKVSLKEEKTDKENETNIIENTAPVSLNVEAQAAPENLVEPALEVADEDGKNESSFTDLIQGVSKDEGCILKIPEQASIDQKGKTDIEEGEYSIPTSVEEKVAFTVADDKKEPEAPGSIQLSSREGGVEINKDEKRNEPKTAKTEDDGPAVENEKGGHTNKNDDEIVSAVTESDRETQASKFEEKKTTKTEVDNLEKEQTEEPVKTEVQVPEEPTKESDATKTSSKEHPKETTAKTAQKQSNSIISKVKHSLAKAKKAIIGKSPSSKNHSTETKDDDIQVK